jgi:hypothetical protein
VWKLLQRTWSHLSANPEDAVLAVILAVICAVGVGLILDVLDPNGRVRTGIRHIKNKRSERSAAKLQKRIDALQVRRNTTARYLDSDKALYLMILRIVLVMLVGIAGGDATAQLEFPLGRGPVVPLSLFFYALAIVGGIQGLKITEFESREKITETITKLDSEIADLQAKLQAMTR